MIDDGRDSGLSFGWEGSHRSYLRQIGFCNDTKLNFSLTVCVCNYLNREPEGLHLTDRTFSLYQKFWDIEVICSKPPSNAIHQGKK